MPLAIHAHPDRVVTPWLWGLLPENPAVLQRWARELHASLSPFSLLATQVGRDCPGAVRFAPEEEAEELFSRRGHVTWLGEVEVADRIRELKHDATSWLGRDFTGQFSLSGAQAKTALLYEGGRWGVPSGATPTTHILKPAVAGLDDHDLNEHLCLEAAGRAGLVVARTRVARFSDESAIVVERYDRRRVGRTMRRVHQEDTCQALAILPTRKYQTEGGPGPTEIVRLVRSAMPPVVAEREVARFVDALAWNWIIGGTDAHAKNYSLLLAGDQVRLSPLYDVASALPYAVDPRKLRFAMKIGTDYRVLPRRGPWPQLAADLGLDHGSVVDRVRALARIAPDAFADAAHVPEVTALRRRLTTTLIDRVSARAAWCLKLLG